MFSGFVKLENVWGADVTIESSDPDTVTVGEVRTYDDGRTYDITLYGGSKGDGYATITAKTPDGRSASLTVHAVYVEDYFAGN